MTISAIRKHKVKADTAVRGPYNNMRWRNNMAKRNFYRIYTHIHNIQHVQKSYFSGIYVNVTNYFPEKKN